MLCSILCQPDLCTNAAEVLCIRTYKLTNAIQNLQTVNKVTDRVLYQRGYEG